MILMTTKADRNAATGRPSPADPVHTIMAENLATVAPEASLRSVAEELTAGEIGAVAVDSPGEPTGLISERDLVTVFAMGGDLDGKQAADVMTTDIVTTLRTDSIASVGRLMRDAEIRHVLVTDGGKIVGLVSIRDVLAALLPEAGSDTGRA
jgi:CBS domain-containing protein